MDDIFTPEELKEIYQEHEEMVTKYQERANRQWERTEAGEWRSALRD